MALSQKDRDTRRHAKAAALQEEDLRLKVRPGTKQALAELMQWAEIEEQGEALTLMIHHVEALGRDALLILLAPRNDSSEKVARETIRFGARPGTIRAVSMLEGWADTDQVIDRLIHGIRTLPQHQAVKFLTPPKHEVRLSPRLELAFSRKSMLMIQQDPGDEIRAPSGSC
jgi:hypothetical protein